MKDKKIHNLAYVRDITIILGRKCNGKCVYCAQAGLSGIGDKTLNEDIIDYVAKLTRFERKDDKDHLQILLYGGEPLLYWDTLKHIVEGIENHPDTVHGTYYYKMFTNGSLLTEDKVEFLNKYHIYVVAGYDGPNIWSRPVRMSDAQVEIFKKLDRKAITFVTSTANDNIVETIIFLKKKFGEDMEIHDSALCTYYNGGEDVGQYIITDRTLYYKNFQRFLTYYENHPIDSLFWHKVRSSLFRTNSMMQDKLDFLTVDTDGVLYGFADKEDSQICTIYDEDGIDKILQYRKSQHSEFCDTCPYNYFCRGFYGVKDETGRAYNCKTTRVHIGIVHGMQERILRILDRPENRKFIESITSTWSIGFKHIGNRGK